MVLSVVTPPAGMGVLFDLTCLLPEIVNVCAAV